MILIVCTPCSLGMRVMGHVEDLQSLVGERCEFWPDKFICPRCEGPARGVLEVEADMHAVARLELVDVDPFEAFAAMHGLGLPAERDCRREVVEQLLREHPIRKVEGATIPGTNRCRIEALELWDGTKLYLGAGAEGAVIYRIRKPAYTEKFCGR